MGTTKMKIYLLNCMVTGLPFVKLICRNMPIAGIISIKKECADSITEYYDYEPFCIEQNISYIAVDTYSLKSDADRERLLALDVDIAITSAWQRLVPEWFIKHCSIGIIGVHGSAVGISGGRGRSPQNWALILGHKKFSLSIFWIDTNIDSGKVIDTKEYEYELIDDISISYHKAAICMAEMIIENIKNGNIVKGYGVEQEGEAGYFPKRIAADGMIDWKRKCCEIYDFVRAITIPYPCAYTTINGHQVKVVRCKYMKTESTLLDSYHCGEIIMIAANLSIWVKCRDGVIEILEYLNEDGVEIKEGQIFDDCNFKEQIKNIIERHNNEVGLPVASVLCQLMEQDGENGDGN